MNDFIFSCWKGLYPYYIFFCIIGVCVKIHRKQWNSFDSLLLSSFAVLELCTAFLPYIFYKNLETSRRYLVIFVPLYLPFASAGVLFLWHKISEKNRTLGKIILILFPLVIFPMIYDMYTPVMKQYTSRHKRRERTINFEAAEWIKKDWNGKQCEPLDEFYCDFYQSGKRPLVQSPYLRIGYLCGGQDFIPFMANRGLSPDYIVTDTLENYPGWQMVHKLQNGYIFKPIE